MNLAARSSSEPGLTTAPAPSPVSDSPQRPHRRRRMIALAAVVAMTAAAIGLWLADPFKPGPNASSGVSDNGYPTSTAAVTRENLSSQSQVNATLGYAGSDSVVNQAQGTFTALPQVGQLVSEGQVLYRVSNDPVVLLYGTTPAYRSLSEGMFGPDVAQLNADLVALGYVTATELPAGTDTFTYWTVVGVEDLQAALGQTVTGTLALGQAVFLPTAARITTVSATLGTQAPPGQPVLSATSTTRVVTVNLDAAEQSQVAVGDHVSISLPNNHTTPGVVTSVGTVASAANGSSTPTITVLVTPTDPAATGSLDQAPVTVAITTATANNVLAVPVDALVALSGGGYAVEVVGSHGSHSLVPVTLGLFDDAAGMAQVYSTALSAGERVVVPAP